MLLTIGVLVTLTAAMITWGARLSRRVSDASLGWMSEQWLAEHRASNPS
ncbi:MAG TPA: hypothetical protein VFO14_22720 [Vicinamibacterales bacterium]|nr:hypothetical protein [Vicinamibacterales bacterium]